MGTDCEDYEIKGYCLRGRFCPYKHGSDLIELDVSDYRGLVEAAKEASDQVKKLTKEEQNKLKRKQADLIANLLSQQRALIEKIELCPDETEKTRLKTTLGQLSQKTKGWIEQRSSSVNT